MQQNQHLRKTARNLDTAQGHSSVHLDNTNSDADISHALTVTVHQNQVTQVRSLPKGRGGTPQTISL